MIIQVPRRFLDWNDFSAQYWNRIFEVLHKKGHISEPRHVMNQEYIMGKLRQPGYKEIVHRYPGRYELSLDAEENNKNDDDESLYHDMPSLQPIIDKLEPVIYLFYNSIRTTRKRMVARRSTICLGQC